MSTAKMMERLDISSITALSEKLNQRKKLLDITNQIHAAQNIKDILVEYKDGILSLFNALLITIFVADKTRNELYSLYLSGSHLKEIRLPISNRSIAGFVAIAGRGVSVADAYDKEELKKIDKNLFFDESWDKQSGYRTTQVLAVPVLHENSLLGVIQIINRKGGGKFTADEQTLLEEIAEVLGIAFYNQHRVSSRRKTRFDYLVTQNLMKESDLESAFTESRKNNEPIEEILMKKFRISREDVGKALEDFYRCRFVHYNPKYLIPDELLKNLKREFLRRELWVPLEKAGGKIRVIVDDPNNILKKDMIENLLKTKSVEYCVSLKEDIIRFINHFYQTQESEKSFIEILSGDAMPVEEHDDVDENGVSESDSVIMQLVNRIINDGIAQRASDIHIEPNLGRKNVEIRYRVDGGCSVYQTVPYSYRAAIVSRVKIMSNLDITERRLPQDGKIKFKRPNNDEIELRVATLPTAGNLEDVVLRILQKGEMMKLEEMAMSPYNYQNFIKLLEKPYGLILVVGPTGSGKTTTLHAGIHRINTPDKKIWTIEDPVEITQYGIRQVQINPKIGLDFARALRAFLRADPDVIMVGEMRDFETAKIGIEASLTGHLVFSTLHTNSAPETIIRLLDMGIDPLNFADSLLGILAQRLARTLCKNCKQVYTPDKDEYDYLAFTYGEEQFARLDIPYSKDLKFFQPHGCSECNQTGYRGRVGIHELLIASENVKRLVARKSTAGELRDAAVQDGMATLLQDGIKKVLEGIMDFEQVRRVCIK